MYDKSAQLLDILLVGKFGSRRINTLMKDFTNNQGVVTDPAQLELLADIVAAYYKDMWDKRYAALTIDYNPIEPYHVELDETKTTQSEDSNTTTNNLTDSTVSSVDDKKTYDIENKDTKDLTETKTGTVTDETSKTEVDNNSNTVVEDIEHSKNDVDTKTTEYNNVTDTDTKNGSRVVSSTDVADNVSSAIDGSVGDQKGQRINKDAVTPYTPVSLRNKEQTTDTDKSHTEENATHETDNTSVTNHNEVETYTDFSDENVKSGSVTETNTDHDNYSDNKTTVDNENNVSQTDGVNTQTHDTAEKKTGTDTVTKKGSETSEQTGVTNTSKTGTVTDEGKENTETITKNEEHGNKWNFSNQQLIEQELEVRKNNFYDSILADIASLLTLSVYRKEDV